MIAYNPKDWFKFIFRFHKTDTFRQLIPIMGVVGIYTGIISYLEIDYWQLSSHSHVKSITIMHTTLGFVLSLLLAYRTNTAYDRWWEGRKMWGALVNSSRNLAIKLSVILENENDRQFFKKAIPMYASILDKHLKNEEISFEIFDDPDLHIEYHKHNPNQVARALFRRINDLYRSKKISGDQLIIINNEIQSLTDICGACERIKNTPIPYSYNVFIKKFIFLFIMTMPLGYAFNLGYFVIPMVIAVFYVLASLELIAEEIEDPFGHDSNDLPTTKIAENIKKNIEEIL